MDEILSYKDAPKYRDIYSASKITSENPKEKTQQTLQLIIKGKMEAKMTKNKELTSNIY